MISISKELSSSVLTIGSQYKDHRGGIGGVIDSYSRYFFPFNYVCTYGTSTNKVSIVFNFIAAIFKLFFLLTFNKQILIVHIHGAAKGSFYRKYIIFNISKYFFNKKVIFHSHASEMEVFYTKSSNKLKWIFKDFFSNVDLIICLSESWYEFYTKNFKVRSIVVLENIVEKPKVLRSKKFHSFPIKFLFLGQIGGRKGIFDLLKVVNNNKKLLKGKFLLYVGGNGDVDKLKSYIIHNDLVDFVKFEGWVSGSKKEQLLNSCDIYILPSYNEGLPLSILEAMSYGMPIASTLVGGIPEIVFNNKNGVLFQPGSENGILKSILYFLEVTSRIESHGRISYDVVLPYFPDSVIPKLESIYRSLLN